MSEQRILNSKVKGEPPFIDRGGATIVGSEAGYGGTPLPHIKLSVRFSFANGEQTEQTAERSEVFAGPQESFAIPYRLGKETAPVQPTLISSASFVQLG